MTASTFNPTDNRNPYICNWEVYWISEVISWIDPILLILTFKIPLGREVDVDMKFPVLCNKSSSSSSLSSKSNKSIGWSLESMRWPLPIPNIYISNFNSPPSLPTSIILFKLQMVKVKQQNKFEGEKEDDKTSMYMVKIKAWLWNERHIHYSD